MKDQFEKMLQKNFWIPKSLAEVWVKFYKKNINMRKGIVKSFENVIMDISNMNIGVVGKRDFFVNFFHEVNFTLGGYIPCQFLKKAPMIKY